MFTLLPTVRAEHSWIKDTDLLSPNETEKDAKCPEMTVECPLKTGLNLDLALADTNNLTCLVPSHTSICTLLKAKTHMYSIDGLALAPTNDLSPVRATENSIKNVADVTEG